MRQPNDTVASLLARIAELEEELNKLIEWIGSMAWEIGSTLDQDRFVVKSKSGFGGPFTWEQAVAVRDALNRLRGDEI